MPFSLLLIPTCLLALSACGDDSGSCDGENCALPPGDTSDDTSGACQQLRACCDQLSEEFEGDEVYSARCLTKLDEASRDPSPSMSCQQLVDSLADWNYCLPSEEEDSSAEANCDELITCAEQVAPDTLPMLRETYGPNGACWTSSEEIQNACLDSCKQALDAYHNSGQCGGGDDETNTYNFPHWLVYDEATLEYCNHKVMCEGGPDTQEDPVGLRLRLCEDTVSRWIHYGPPPCDEQVRAELLCRLERGGCDTETWCGPEIDEACTR